ncbi:MAG TPA: hypothetical protein VNP72_01740 [Longimicrobium sp.]|nr:hypothetical protein [Longimicrobium sp.]
MARPDSVDPEEVAALLDGRLTAEERAALMERLARSPEDFEMLAEAMRLVGDDPRPVPPPPVPELAGATLVEADPAAVPVPPPSPVGAGGLAVPPSMGRVRPRRLWIPVVAVLALALLVPFALRRDGGGAGLRLRGSDLVDERGNGSLADALDPGWAQPGWAVMRGGGSGAADLATEFRIGVRLVDVEIALDTRDAAAVRLVQPDLAELLKRRQAPPPLVAEYEDIGARAGNPTAKLASDGRRAAAQTRDEFRDSPAFEAGVWVEQARLATLGDEWDFFDARFAGDLDGVIANARGGGMDASFVKALEQVRALVRDGVAPSEQTALSPALARVVELGAG